MKIHYPPKEERLSFIGQPFLGSVFTIRSIMKKTVAFFLVTNVLVMGIASCVKEKSVKGAARVINRQLLMRVE